MDWGWDIYRRWPENCSSTRQSQSGFVGNVAIQSRFVKLQVLDAQLASRSRQKVKDRFLLQAISDTVAVQARNTTKILRTLLKGWWTMMYFNTSQRFATRAGFWLVLLTTLALLSCAAFAQTTVSTGSIVGTVTDATGAVVAGAKVTLKGSTGQTVQTTSSGTGSDSSGALVPGSYSVRVESKGFKTAQLSLNVQVDNTANGSIKLEL